MRQFLFLSIFFFSATLSVNAQSIKFKKNTVLVDKEVYLNYERSGTVGSVSYDLSELSSGNRVIVLVQNNAGSPSDISDDYTKIIFLKQGSNLEISGGDLRNALKLLMKNEVLRKDGTLDETKIDLFIKNYDEQISERTLQVR
jgi:hypothetical protein